MVPLEFLQDSVSKKVVVNMADQSKYTGILKNFDIYVNIVLDDAEYQNEEKEIKEKIGQTLIQGVLVTHIEVAN